MKPLGVPDPRRIGPYRIFAQLGRGGMGRVFLAGAPDGRLVALKLVHVQHVEEPGFRERFRREVAASRRVSGAYTAPVVDADVETEIPWLVTVFVPGPSLRQAVEAAGPLPPDTALRLAAGLAAALGEIHAAGLVHRDLKPSNVLLAADGPRVIDFGVARAADGNTSELTHTGWLVGSPGYMSPEQAESKPLTPASDVFSLGAVVYMACTGVEPFMGASTPATLYNVVHAEPDLEAVPERLRGVVAACLAKDPAARPTPEQVLAWVGDVPAVTQTWPDAVHALIAEQGEEVVAALRDGGSPDVAVVPLLAEESISDSGAWGSSASASGTWAPNTTGSGTWASGAPDGSTMAGPDRRGRSRRALTAVLAVGALAVGGTVAALVTTSSGGSPSAATPPISSSAAPEISSTVPSVAVSSSAAPTPPITTTPSATLAPSKTPTPPVVSCLSQKTAYSLAKQQNNNYLPSDTKISVLKCDAGWAAASMTSASVGDAAVVYEVQDGAWKVADLGAALCGDNSIAKAPADVLKSVNC